MKDCMREMSKWCEEVMREQEDAEEEEEEEQEQEQDEEQEDTNVHAITKVWSLAAQDLIHCFLFGSQEIGEHVKRLRKI